MVRERASVPVTGVGRRDKGFDWELTRGGTPVTGDAIVDQGG